MSSQSSYEFLPEEQHVVTIAQAFPYPETPNVGRGFREKLAERSRPRIVPPSYRRALALACALLLVLASLLAVPQVRAAVWEWLQIGAIRIFNPESVPAPTIPPAPTPDLLQLGSPVTLNEAQEALDFPVLQPPDLGPPDATYLQETYGSGVVSLVWFDAAAPAQIRAMLWQLGIPEFVRKWVYLDQMQETTVNGNPAFWLTGPHPLQLLDQNASPPRLVTNTVLTWTDGSVTYRLEGDFTLEEAIHLAESMEPVGNR